MKEKKADNQRIKRGAVGAASAALWLLVAYLMAAQVIFALRHPHAGEGARLLHLWDALTLQTVEAYQ